MWSYFNYTHTHITSQFDLSATWIHSTALSAVPPEAIHPPVFIRLATKRRSLPKEKSATHSVEFLRQRNSVSRTTYILTISHDHTRRFPHLLSQINHYVYSSTQSPKSTTQPARHTCFHQANKKKIFSTAVTNPTLYSTESRTTCPSATSHAHVVIRYLYPLPFHHPHLTSKYTHLRPTAPNIPFYGSIFCVLKWYYAICFMFHLT